MFLADFEKATVNVKLELRIYRCFHGLVGYDVRLTRGRSWVRFSLEVFIYTFVPVAQRIRHLTTNQGIVGSNPTGDVFVHWPSLSMIILVYKSYIFFIKKFPRRDLNPGLTGESRVSWPTRLWGIFIEQDHYFIEQVLDSKHRPAVIGINDHVF